MSQDRPNLDGLISLRGAMSSCIIGIGQQQLGIVAHYLFGIWIFYGLELRRMTSFYLRILQNDADDRDRLCSIAEEKKIAFLSLVPSVSESRKLHV